MEWRQARGCKWRSCSDGGHSKDEEDESAARCKEGLDMLLVN